jgi:hypothetical protein
MANAYEIPSLRFSSIAAEAITRRRFIKPTTETTASMADAGEAVIGVSMNDPASSEVLEIADGIVMVEAGGTVAVGAEVQSGTNGVAVTLASGIKAGTCLTGGDSGHLLTIKMSV